jgi:hypothetical protein
VWNADESDALAAPEGALDARGTPHDVPVARDCMGCHGGTASRVLGFSAIQLNHEAEAPDWSLRRLSEEGRLIGASSGVAALPGDENTRRVLGYLHANCGHCHNQHRPTASAGGRCYDPRRDFDLSLRAGKLATVHDTPLFQSAIGRVIVPGKPESSSLYQRARGDYALFQSRMPPLASETVDPGLLPLLAGWIRSLGPRLPRAPTEP